MTEYFELENSLPSLPEMQTEVTCQEENVKFIPDKKLLVQTTRSLSVPLHQTIDAKTRLAENLPLYQLMNNSALLCDNEVLIFYHQELRKEQFLATTKNSCVQFSKNVGHVPSFRRNEVTSMLSFANRLSLSPETVLTAVHYFDSVVCKHFLQTYMVPSISAAALWLATKLHEREVFGSKYFLSYRSLMGTVSRKTLVDAESTILSTLGWKVNVTTTYHCIQIFGLLLTWLHKDFIHMAESLCKYAMMEEGLMNFSYPVQAASCIFISVRISAIKELSQTLLDSLYHLSIPVDEVFNCSEILWQQSLGGSLRVKDQQMSPKSIREWDYL
ncbi:hypothetical protein Gasu2_13290 [Galdieria sulphuraria]|uniref:Cyclin-like domain-containing protein n=1 Tax=Galdieria sulphuraria TaxID=130081 RepID=M2XZC4_GALSU|nr:uncharacterized protein Gasu_35740 [Galdieria sulphuraria]EME29003.1 hypothetical protein Gasu_35740 [Galdieria sulphuraria]GJD06941.1 hypothetical protein Gasu2_13290 [Galdieria sulphuraria]|eukprot:XP_005705523.1 hypothetical protein Gasu_35740 [Galdieria sulphuraria]